MSVRFKELNKISKDKLFVYEAALVEIAVVSFFLCELCTECIGKTGIKESFFNIIIFYIIVRFLNLLFGVFGINGVFFSSILANVIGIFLGTLEYYVVNFRGVPVMTRDFWALDTAMSVASEYNFYPTLGMAVSLALFAIQTIFVSRVGHRKGQQAFSKIVMRFVRGDAGSSDRVTAIGRGNKNLSNCIIDFDVAGILLVVFMSLIFPNLECNFWDEKGIFERQGTMLSLVSYSRYDNDAEMPEGYDPDYCVELMENMPVVEPLCKTVPQNIIVIMNESFADLRVINDEIIGDEYLEFVDSLEGEAVKGNLYVPVFGAGTHNSESEFLTGISGTYMDYVYKRGIRSDTDSVARRYLESGYRTLAYHPYLKENWSRSVVYPLLGFEEFFSIDDMEKIEESDYVRGWISDKCDYGFVLDQIESNGKPVFMFNVTIQNHGGYGDDDRFEKIVDLSEYGSFPYAENYLSLLKESDDAIRGLIEDLKGCGESTIVCFFGDHQPSLEEGFYELMFGKKELGYEEEMIKHITPFFIWANYGFKKDLIEQIEQDYVDVISKKSGDINGISSNYLGVLLMLLSGREIGGYESFLWSLHEKYPIICPYGCYDRDGTYYNMIFNIDDEVARDYQKLEYHRLSSAE